MEEKEFEILIKAVCNTKELPEALNLLKACEDDSISSAANDLTGQFSLAEINGKNKIYHVFSEENTQGEVEEFVELVMELGEDIIVFVAWFFFTQFDIKNRDIYSAAGRTYKQPKRT